MKHISIPIINDHFEILRLGVKNKDGKVFLVSGTNYKQLQSSNFIDRDQSLLIVKHLIKEFGFTDEEIKFIKEETK